MPDLILLVLATGLLVVLAARSAVLGRGRPLVALAALTPYAVAAGIPLTALALLVADQATAVAMAVPTAFGMVAVGSRCVPRRSSRPGQSVRVLTANLLRGRADAEALVALVRTHRVDVLCLQELNVDGVDALKRAGLTDELPRVFFDDALGGSGDVGVACRHPAVPAPAAGGFVTGVRLPGAVEVFSAHPIWPMGARGPRPWRAALAALPSATGGDAFRIVAGDFNATLDHGALRQVLATGYRDAGAAAGAGLRPTWPGVVRSPWPPVTIDHVLAGPGGAIRSYAVFGLPGSDHRAVFADVVLPG